MRAVDLVWLASACAVVVRATQIPLGKLRPTSTWSDPGDLTLEAWNLDKEPGVNSTDHLVFDTAKSLLQHWPNTRYRNGHTIIPGIVPPGTLLYHGTSVNKIPTVPEWTATDVEHSYLFCRGENGCWHLTLITTRALKVLYFDGSSAAKMVDGPMDSQDLLVWGEARPDRAFGERQRIKDLCEWGKVYGIDGYVRMEMDFEVMLCDFSAGTDVASFNHLVSPKLPSRRRPPRRTPPISATRAGAIPTATPEFWGSTAFASFASIPEGTHYSYEVIHSGSWHNYYPGETRVQLDLTRLVSFYDTSLFPSLVAPRLHTERWYHRLANTSRTDIGALHTRLDEVLNEEAGQSGIDWWTLFRVITDRYADRLELVKLLLNGTVDDEQTDQEQAQRVQLQLHIMLTPYMLYSAVLPSEPSFVSSDRSWASPIFKECATAHTSHIAKLSPQLTRSEQLLLRAVRGTSREICRVVVNMWSEGVLAGLDEGIMPNVKHNKQIRQVVRKWKIELDALMGWLDWSEWVRCDPACKFEEICYLPTWPFFRRNPNLPPVFLESEPGWVRPQPRCLRRFAPYNIIETDE